MHISIDQCIYVYPTALQATRTVPELSGPSGKQVEDHTTNQPSKQSTSRLVVCKQPTKYVTNQPVGCLQVTNRLVGY